MARFYPRKGSDDRSWVFKAEPRQKFREDYEGLLSAGYRVNKARHAGISRVYIIAYDHFWDRYGDYIWAKRGVGMFIPSRIKKYRKR